MLLNRCREVVEAYRENETGTSFTCDALMAGILEVLEVDAVALVPCAYLLLGAWMACKYAVVALRCLGCSYAVQPVVH